MKFLKRFGITILILALIIVLGSYFLPSHYQVSRSTVIQAADSTIYQNIADFNKFTTWNPWSKMEPTAVVKVSGPIAQPNHLYEWVGDKTGEGYMKIKAVKPNQMVDIELKFIEPFESLADTKFELKPEGNAQKVTWTMSGKHNIISKWMCVFVSMDSMIGKDFENGLQSLKEKSESGN